MLRVFRYSCSNVTNAVTANGVHRVGDTRNSRHCHHSISRSMTAAGIALAGH